MPRTTLHRSGRQRRPLAAEPSRLVALLGDVERLGELVLPLLDAGRSRLPPPDPRWSVRPMGIGRTAYRVVLLPHVEQVADRVLRTSAVSAPTSDLPVRLVTHAVVAAAPVGASLDVRWELAVTLRLPRPLAALASPVVDQTVAHVLDDLTTRAVSELEAG